MHDHVEPHAWPDPPAKEVTLVRCASLPHQRRGRDGVQNRLPMPVHLVVPDEDVEPTVGREDDFAAAWISGVPHGARVPGFRPSRNPLFERRP